MGMNGHQDVRSGLEIIQGLIDERFRSDDRGRIHAREAGGLSGLLNYNKDRSRQLHNEINEIRANYGNEVEA